MVLKLFLVRNFENFLGYGFSTLVLNRACFSEETTVLFHPYQQDYQQKPFAKPFNHSYYGLSSGPNYEAGLKQGVD